MTAVIVIGGGIAGCAVANALAAHGAEVLLLESGPTLASGASGNLAGALYPLLTAAPSPLGDYYVAAFRRTLVRLRQLAQGGRTQDLWHPCGVLLQPKDAASAARFAKIARREEMTDLVHPVTASEASQHAGITLPHGGLLLPDAGWVRPPLLCAALIAEQADRITVRLQTPVSDIRAHHMGWQAIGPDGGPLATAPCLVLATASSVTRFAPTAHLPVRPNRGQLTYLPASTASAQLRSIVCGQGYVLPVIAGQHVIGASYARGETDTTIRPADSAANLARLAMLCPEFSGLMTDTTGHNLSPDHLPARAAIRATTPDHLPIAGPIAERKGLFVLTGLGSRGLTTALYAAEHLADILIRANAQR